MGSAALAAGIMAALGLLFGSILALAYRFLRVPEDPRLEQVEGMLPGTNCGACGEPGCHAFAERLLASIHQPSKCSVSSPDAVDAIAEFLGVDAGQLDRLVARLHCAGGRAQARQIAEYEGAPNCRAASVVAGGGKGCAWGCLGLGDCEVACTFDAIWMNDNGLPVVVVDKCTACGDCVDSCPKDLFDLAPLRQRLCVQCSVPLAGDEARALCTVACDACGRCAQDAPEDLIRMVDNLAVVDYAADVEAGPECTFRCPTGAIQWVPVGQFAGEELASSSGGDDGWIR